MGIPEDVERHERDGAGFEKPAQGSQFLQIMAKPKRVAHGRSKPEPKLTRVAFKVSRLMEFCSERELQNQTGHSSEDWPLMVAKETVDNALDACEEAEVAPDITVIVDPDAVIIQDNAGGIDTETIESTLDYTVRVSSREAYVSQSRGAQGNALKTILAMAYVLDRKIGSEECAKGTEKCPELRELMSVRGEINTRSFGRLLTSYGGRTRDGWCIRVSDQPGKSRVYNLECIALKPEAMAEAAAANATM